MKYLSFKMWEDVDPDLKSLWHPSQGFEAARDTLLLNLRQEFMEDLKVFVVTSH